MFLDSVPLGELGSDLGGRSDEAELEYVPSWAASVIQEVHSLSQGIKRPRAVKAPCVANVYTAVRSAQHFWCYGVASVAMRHSVCALGRQVRVVLQVKVSRCSGGEAMVA